MQLIDTFRRQFFIIVSFSLLSSPLRGQFDGPVDSDSWRAIQVPGVWEDSGLAGTDQYEGFAWYRCWAMVPTAWLKNDVFIATEQIDNVHEIRINGHRVGGRAHFHRIMKTAWGAPKSISSMQTYFTATSQT